MKELKTHSLTQAKHQNLKLYQHQVATLAQWQKNYERNTGFLIASDPGTGKTPIALKFIQKNKTHGKTLVITTKSTMEAAWTADADRFTPWLRYQVAYAKNRKQAFQTETDIVITNHDAVKWIYNNAKLLVGFKFMIIDESTAFKNFKSQRSIYARLLSELFPHVAIMTGTFTPNSILDAWSQIYLIDGGERLGKAYYSFRYHMCDKVINNSFTKWVDKPEAPELVSGMIHDISVRYKLEDVIDMPEHIKRYIRYELKPRHAELYKELRDNAVLNLTGGKTDPQFSRVGLRQKLMQAAAGMLYTDKKGSIAELDTFRIMLAADLVKERKHSIVVFCWIAQKIMMEKQLKKDDISYAVIDGSVKDNERLHVVNEYQAGKYQTLLIQPQAAAHGLTLTRGTATIWLSPPPGPTSELFIQTNHRIYRSGQTKRTETIMICAHDTLDERAYNMLDNKLANMDDTLYLIEGDTE